jgi:hypothetical protein
MSMRAYAGDRRAIHATPFHTGKGAQTGTATALLHDQLTATTTVLPVKSSRYPNSTRIYRLSWLVIVIVIVLVATLFLRIRGH